MWIDIDNHAAGGRHHSLRFEQIALVTQWKGSAYITLIGATEEAIVLDGDAAAVFHAQFERCRGTETKEADRG